MTGWPLFHSYDLSYGLIFAAGVMLAVGIRLGGLILARRTRKPVSQTAIRNTARTISAAPLVLLLPRKSLSNIPICQPQRSTASSWHVGVPQ